MKIYNLLFTLILFINSNIFNANATEYKLRRFSTELYEEAGYGSSLKFKLEKRNQEENDLDSVKTKKPIKNGRYTGVYKVGNPYTVLGQTYYPREQSNYKEIGMASWYGGEFNNKKTANGEIYNMNDYTAAHTTLPLPCIVKVTNLENGKSTKVRVNDRGPFVKNRIIDVSKKVAKKLDFHNQGTTKVKVEYLEKDSKELLEDYGLK
ncbi:MAG: septal ring lytic transglycosylase RlpA family protein [Rickettsiales bacterium]|nr:septal ring lytic transglycosylase RlpA family protein [Rickettsiales bacterium]